MRINVLNQCISQHTKQNRNSYSHGNDYDRLEGDELLFIKDKQIQIDRREFERKTQHIFTYTIHMV